MCFELDSLPPIPVISGAAVSHEDIVLEAEDGNRFAAFLATPEEAGDAAVLVLPDVRGLYRFYEELALRFAERGIGALAIDYFGRTAGVGKRGDDFPYMEHVDQATPEGIRADVAAGIARLRSAAFRAIFTVGFCFGGRQSWLAAADQELAGAIGFYGRPGIGRDGSVGPAQRAAEISAPILGLMGGADEAITRDDIADFERALDAAEVDHDIVVYDGAPHSFFDRKQEEFAPASEDAWTRVLDFIAKYG